MKKVLLMMYGETEEGLDRSVREQEKRIEERRRIRQRATEKDWLASMHIVPGRGEHEE